MRKISKDELEEILEQHDLWLRSNKAKGKKASLSRTNLCHTDFGGANLSRVGFYFSDLKCANLSGCNLRLTDLSHADLSGANLAGGDLSHAELSYANLRYADFAELYLGSTIFVAVDFTKGKNLDSCSHYSCSHLDHETLRRSRNLPVEFLRGCGLNDWEIETTKLYNPELKPNELTDITYKIHEIKSGPAIDFFSCFISYNHKDKEFARKLHDCLQERGVRCWLDEHDLLPGDDLYEGIDRGIMLWDKVLLCASEHSLTSGWVDDEIDRAFEKERELMKDRKKKVLSLIPLDLDGYLFSDEYLSGKKQPLRSRVAASFKDAHKDAELFNRELERVIKSLMPDDAGRKPAPPSKL